jgi:hypothetical protein
VTEIIYKSYHEACNFILFTKHTLKHTLVSKDEKDSFVLSVFISMATSLSKTSPKQHRKHRHNPKTRKKQVQKDRDKELDIALNKPGRAEKGEKPKNRRIIKITTGNVCTDSFPNSNIMRTPPRFVDIFWEEKHTARVRYSRKPLYYSG